MSSQAPRYSSSPIPLPTIPHHALALVRNGTAPGVWTSPNVPQPATHLRPQPEIIIIDDDDNDDKDNNNGKDEVKEEKPSFPENLPEVKKPAAANLLKPKQPFEPQQPIQSLGPSEEALQEPLTGYPNPPQKNFAKAAAVPIVSAAAPPKATTDQAQSRTPRNFRREVYPLVWRDRALDEVAVGNSLSKFFSETSQPYMTAEQRGLVLNSGQQLLQLDDLWLRSPVTCHVDFSLQEIRYLCTLARKTLALATRWSKDPKKDLGKVLKANPRHIPRILDAVARGQRFPRRTRADIDNLFRDLIDRKASSDALRLTIEKDDCSRREHIARSSRLHSLLFAREVVGQRGFGTMRRLEHFNNEFRKCREDALELRADWTGCAGDIMTVAWVSNDGFICGTTEHSDSHNQQYNKPGNLVLGSCSSGTLRAYPDHRIVRPIVEKGENSTDAMVQSQDPWLYSSVVSSDYDAVHGRAFTSGFDRSVKIWQVEQSGASMSLVGEWGHGGNVNFVAASKHGLGMVATAADVPSEAVRIYNVDENNVSQSPFRSYSCSRVTDAEGNTVSTEKWAYFPATMQWGLADGVKHLLLVGYSPRSRTDDDLIIPDDRRDSGELCLWDGLTGERWRVTAATTQNVFEVLWHPNQASFIAATSPLGNDLEPSVRTQIRIFRPAETTEFGSKAFSPVKTLDCTAIDINELTIMYVGFPVRHMAVY